jgi:DNA processing protein
MKIEITKRHLDALFKIIGDRVKVDSIIKRNEVLGIETIASFDKEYPECFLEIGDEKPSVIFALGNLELLNAENKVAVIGARKADRNGNAAAYQLGAEYARKGCVVVSGLALGCDAAAHQGCLDAKGGTIAIVATGLDLTHPHENEPLQKAILRNGGLLISEQILGVKANPSRLVARNRLQAALSDPVVVAQCPEHSGTMYTVRFAQQYKKRVLAVKFPYSNDLSSGNNLLIEAGQAEAIKI